MKDFFKARRCFLSNYSPLLAQVYQQPEAGAAICVNKVWLTPHEIVIQRFIAFHDTTILPIGMNVLHFLVIERFFRAGVA